MNNKKQSFFGRLFSKKPKKIQEDNTIITPFQAIIRNFCENKLAVSGLIGFILIIILIFGGSSIFKFDVNYTETVIKNTAPGTNYLKFPSELNGKVKKIVSGTSFSFAIDNEGKLHSWGVNNPSGVLTIPDKVKNSKIEDIDASPTHVIALTSNGEIIQWGDNSVKQSEMTSIASTRARVGIKKVFVGPLYSGLLLNNNTVVTWGSNTVQQLSFKTEWQGHIVDVQPTNENILVLLDDGSVQVTGASVLSSSIPEQLTNGSAKIKKIASTYLNGFALSESGELYTWGLSGIGFDSIPKFDKKIKDIQAGYENVLVLFEDGTIQNLGSNTHYNQDKVPSGNFESISADYFQNYAIDKEGNIKAWGLNGFMLGTDELGRDVLVRLIYGGQTSLLVGLVAVSITTIIGLIIGLIAGFVGGTVDNLLMRFAEIITSIPFLPLLITLSAILGSSLDATQRMYLVMVIIGFLSWVGLARLIRGQILIEREKDFILAARALGIRESKIIMKHIFPSILSIVIVSMTLNYGSMMLTEAGLSFLGFGVVQPTPTWGNMLNGAQSAEVIQYYWWRWLFPALAVFITVLAVNLVGDGLRDAVDPKSNQK